MKNRTPHMRTHTHTNMHTHTHIYKHTSCKPVACSSALDHSVSPRSRAEAEQTNSLSLFDEVSLWNARKLNHLSSLKGSCIAAEEKKEKEKKKK